MVLGSIVYENVTLRQLQMGFFSSILGETTKELIDYPQSPLDQTWIIQYPLLAYKCFTPDNREIALVHLAHNQPQMIVNLGEWEFISFVNSSQTADYEPTDSRIFHFLAQYNQNVRIMKFAIRPYEKEDKPYSLSIFTGKLAKPNPAEA